MMKTQLLFLSAFALLLGSCSKDFDQPTPPASDATPGQVTITIKADVPAESQPHASSDATPPHAPNDTRAGFTPGSGSELLFTWHALDAVSIVVPEVAGNENAQFTASAEAAAVDLTGRLTEWSGAKKVYGLYPYTQAAPAVSAKGKITAMLPGVQAFAVGGARTNMLMVAAAQAATPEDIKLSFKQASSTLRFAVSGLAAGEKVVRVTVAGADAIFATTADFDPATGVAANLRNMVAQIMTEVSGAEAGTATTVDVGLLPADLTGKPLTIKVTTDKGKIYSFSKDGRDFARNVHYKLALDCSSVTPLSGMIFTIDTSKGTTALTTDYALPIMGSLAGCELTVDWGDGNTEMIDFSSSVAEAARTHSYASDGTYTIVITSSLTDPTQQQMPPFSHLVSNQSALKLISLDSPLLNMGADLSDCFSGCAGLKEIPAGLFTANILATTFEACFADCTGLTAVPAKLFATNAKAENFSYCFQYCSELTAIPAGLFTENAKATDFSYCFYGCTGLTGAIPAGLFTENAKATDFWSCFSGCTGLTEIPATLFEKNIAATDFSYCFSGCTGLTAVPALLFTENIAATNFSYCFYDCTELALNANIFCNETDQNKTTRFTGKKMNFSYCFQNCGSALAANAGGTAPALWSYEMLSTSTKTGCFVGVTKVTNVGDIATGWK